MLRAESQVPSPISVSPSQQWEGNDGNWSTLALRVGSPKQSIRVLVCLAAQQTWTIGPGGCTELDSSNCFDLRGGIFNPNASNTWLPASEIWKNNGTYELGDEISYLLGEIGTGEFGFDTVGLSFDGPSLNHTIVASVITTDYYLGQLGISPRPSNFTVTNHNSSAFDDPQPSLLFLLKEQKIIPSLSWGFGAGSHFQSMSHPNAFSSLTFGGYDSGRSTGPTLSIDMGPDDGRELIVSVNSILEVANPATNLVVNGSFLAALDSTQPNIWVPSSVCNVFESIFGLTIDRDTGMYFLNSDQYSRLLARNPTLVFELSGNLASDTRVNVTLPYGALDLMAEYPIADSPSPYFPLRCSNDSMQYTLGRAFLQEAYIVADYERRNFSISQARWPPLDTSGLVPILPSNSTSQLPSQIGQHKGIIRLTGTIVGSAVAALVVLIVVICVVRQRRIAQKKRSSVSLKDQESYSKPELDAQGNVRFETDGSPRGYELDAELNQVYHVAELDREEVTGELAGEVALGELEGQNILGELEEQVISGDLEGQAIIGELEGEKRTILMLHELPR